VYDPKKESLEAHLESIEKYAFPKYHAEKAKLVDQKARTGPAVVDPEKLVRNFRLEREVYQSFLRQYRNGDVTYV
jgi:hypothetical protein